jgi:uncharacterized repeat protein (TIGR03803 family)
MSRKSIARLGALASGLLTALGVPEVCSAQSVEVLHSFSGPDGAYPSARLLEVSNGVFYGTTVWGGEGNAGTIFTFTLSAGEAVISSFHVTNGLRPYVALALGPSDVLYGLTTYGGLTNLAFGMGQGTLFKLTESREITTLVYFDRTNGAEPYGDLTLSSGGALFGTTASGGAVNSAGTVFRFDPPSGLVTLALFNLMNGGAPSGRLIEMPDGSFYGTTIWGGPPNSVNPYGSGTVFRLSTNGQITTVAAFDGLTGGRPQGMILASDGNFYGTTLDPGAGTVFKMTPAGALSVLTYFHGRDGDQPEGLLLEASDGFLYGTTSRGGSYGAGNVFRVSTNGVLTTIVSFDGTNGLSPAAGLIQASDGNLCGTTYAGGASDLGTIFRIVPPPRLAADRKESELILSWPTNYSGFTLQSSDNLASPVWRDCTNAPAVAGAHFWVTNTPSAESQFYRLKK